ncbi:MAG: aminotransferase class IV [Rhodospirillales bacterium]|nr:aminotransferase class IV [Rhodospirillales bacterium]
MSIVWFNGTILPRQEAVISTTDRGFLLGDGIFDTMLATTGKPVYAAKHIDRLFDHAAVLKIQPSFTKNEIETAIAILLQKNELQNETAALRITITRGPGPRGLSLPDREQPTVLITAGAYAPPPDKPLTAIIAQTVRRNEGSPLSHIKSLNYGDNILALNEAREKGADTALMMNNAGYVCCAVNGNIFIEENDRLYTPPLSDGVINGIMRSKIMKDRKVTEESLTPERVINARGVWTTNSLIGMKPLETGR